MSMHVMVGEYVGRDVSGTPTGWLRAAWIDAEGEGRFTGTADITHVTRKLTTQEMAELPKRNAHGGVLR